MLESSVARAVRDIPGCVGISVWRVEDGVPSTVLAIDRTEDDALELSPSDAAVLDAVQFLDCGPGTDVVGPEPVIGTDLDTLFRRWPFFAAVAGSRGVRATVAVPVQAAFPGQAPGGPGEPAWQPYGVVVLYLAGPVLVDAALVRLAEAVGVTVLMSDGLPGLDEVEHEPARASRRALASLLLERELGLRDGAGEGLLDDAAGHAGIGTGDLADAVTEILRP